MRSEIEAHRDYSKLLDSAGCAADEDGIRDASSLALTPLQEPATQLVGNYEAMVVPPSGGCGGGLLTRKRNAMRSALLGLVTVMVFTCVGCHHNLAPKGGKGDGCGCSGLAGGGLAGLGLLSGRGSGSECADCEGAGAMNRRPTRVARLPHGYMDQVQPAGPPSASYGYPYYTTRAPRDFLQANPASIGY